MASAWSSGLNLQSSTYEDHEKTGLTFMDFIPDCQDSGGLFAAPVYENFKTTVDRANNWLQTNRKWKIITCESVEFRAKRKMVDSNQMIYLEFGEATTCYIRGLRLWLMKCQEECDREQQIGYLNLIPKQVRERGIFTSPSFETLDEVIQRFNSTVRFNQLSGRIITIECQEMKMPNWKELDPDRSIWYENGSMNRHYLFVIRIFYEIMPENSEEIGIKDFVPNKLTAGGLCSLPEYEPFSNAVKEASYWYAQQRGIRFCNAQSLVIKVKRGQDFNTQKMDYMEHGSTATFYLRILRIAFTRSLDTKYPINGDMPSFGLFTCKTFIPVQLTKGCCVPEYENLIKTKERISAWISATGACVASAETTAVRMLEAAKYGTEASFSYNRAETNEYWIFVIRLYLHGIYKEPPPEMLPVMPEIENRNCCIII